MFFIEKNETYICFLKFLIKLYIHISNMKLHNAVYAGSFNPFHQGHLAIIQKALPLFDQIYVVITRNINKATDNPILSNRLNHVVKFCQKWKQVHVLINENQLTVDLCKKINAQFLIRGLRQIDDYKSETKLYAINRFLDHKIETVFFMVDPQNQTLSSSALREINFYKKISK